MTGIAKFFGAASVAAVYLMNGVANAAPVTFLFSGQVTQSSITSTADVGATLSGSFTFDDSTVDSDPSAAFGFYANTMSDFSFEVGNYQGAATSGSIVVVNDIGALGNVDIYQFRSFSGPPHNLGPSIGDFDPLEFRAFISSATVSLFGDDSLPTTPPNISEFVSTSFNFTLFNQNTLQFAALTGVINTITAGGVPVPAASALLIIGLAAIGLRKKKDV